jgi:hypothetical protein
MASCELAATYLLGIVDYVASHAEPHVEHEGAREREGMLQRVRLTLRLSVRFTAYLGGGSA